MNALELIAFEDDIAALFNAGQIRAPVHLSGGNEEELIRIFEEVKESDWVFSTHRSHYHALLKGIPADWLTAQILAGHSITINSREHRFFSSAIVAGVLPIALGVAMSRQRVWCFVGDMAAETGIFHECVKYAHGHDLPIRFVVEDNGLSVVSPTQDVWGHACLKSKVEDYEYHSTRPHQGAGKWIVF